MIHKPFTSLEAMLSVDAMSALEGRDVEHVEVDRWPPDAFRAISGCEFLKVRSSGRGGCRQYVVKRTSYATDLIMRLSDDRRCRERLVWERGILDVLPAEVTSPMLAHAIDGDGWALLMCDVSASLQPLERRRGNAWNVLSGTQATGIVDALASIHAAFYGNPSLEDPSLGLCTAAQLYTWTTPAVLEREGPSTNWFIDAQRSGWAMLERLESVDVAAALRQLRADPTPLVDALARYPATLVHGDPRRENIGFSRTGRRRLVLIDWQFAAALPPTVDLAWMVMNCQPMALSKEQVIDRYHGQLASRLGAHFDERTWEPQLRLALLGQALRVMGHMLWAAHQTGDLLNRERMQGEIPWLCEQARAGLAHL